MIANVAAGGFRGSGHGKSVDAQNRSPEGSFILPAAGES